MFGESTVKYDYTSMLEELEKTKLDIKKLDSFLQVPEMKINAYVDTKKKMTLLHRLIKKSKLLATKWLLENQANPYTEDEHHLPAFFYFIHSLKASKLFFSSIFTPFSINFEIKSDKKVF